MTSEYKPYPQWDCEHQWVDVGLAYVSWTGTSISDKPPPDAPLQQEMKCIICGGYSWQYISRTNK